MLKFALEQRCEWRDIAASRAAEHGHVHILQWTVQAGYPINYHIALCFAARGGQIATLDWLKLFDIEIHPRPVEEAATHGHIHVLAWLLNNGYTLSPKAVVLATSHNQISSLKWLHANGCEMPVEACTVAATKGHFACLRFLRSVNCPWNFPQVINGPSGHAF